MGLHPLALRGGALLPLRDGALIQVEGGDDSLWGTAMRQQVDDSDDQLLLMPQAVEGRALRLGESLAALLALVAEVPATVNDNIAFGGLSFGRAVQVGAECCLRVRALIPSFLLAQKKKGSASDSRLVKNQCLHALLWSYL